MPFGILDLFIVGIILPCSQMPSSLLVSFPGGMVFPPVKPRYPRLLEACTSWTRGGPLARFGLQNLFFSPSPSGIPCPPKTCQGVSFSLPKPFWATQSFVLAKLKWFRFTVLIPFGDTHPPLFFFTYCFVLSRECIIYSL